MVIQYKAVANKLQIVLLLRVFSESEWAITLLTNRSTLFV